MNTVVTQANTHLSEIFILKYDKPNICCFHLNIEIYREVGNRFSWRFNQKLSNVVVIWQQGYFWVLVKPKALIPKETEWRQALSEIGEELREDLGDRYCSIQWVQNPEITSLVIAELAVGILKIVRPFYSDKASSQKQVEVKRECEFWAETIELKQEIKPALTL